DLVEAAREAADAGFDVLVACAFNFEAHTTEFSKLGRIPVLKARMNADLHMADELKNSGIRGHQRRICRQRRLPGSVQYRRGSGRDRHLTDLRTGREM
ncbi:MAG TPA: hypothetical protein VF178_07200, partial [Gemmatimonadaceae bacterium]